MPREGIRAGAGVALFAEMSILSNVTACLILFFQHPIKVGDTIGITHEGKDIEGELIEITYFFAFIKTPNSGTLTIPNALFLKSSFQILEKSSKSTFNMDISNTNITSSINSSTNS